MFTRVALQLPKSILRVARTFAGYQKGTNSDQRIKANKPDIKEANQFAEEADAEPFISNFRIKTRSEPDKKSSLRGDWITKPSHSDDFDDELSNLLISVDPKELEVYYQEFRMNREEVELLRYVLEGKGVSKFKLEQVKQVLNIIDKLKDIPALPNNHLLRFAKWIGTSIIRKVASMYSKKVYLRLYFWLAKRRAIPNLLGYEEGTETQYYEHIDFDPLLADRTCAEMVEEFPKLLTICKKKVQELFYETRGEKKVLDPKKFYEYMDIIVSLSNLNLYRFECYQSAKLLLWYMMKYMPDEVELHECIAIKASNFYWAFIKVRVPDTEFTTDLLHFYTFKYLHRNERRQRSMLYCLSIEYILKQAYFAESSDKLKPVILSISRLLGNLKQLATTPNKKAIYNPKNCVTYGQLMLSLFPELGPFLRGKQELIDCQPEASNPFKEHFYWMTDELVTSISLARLNIECKKTKGRPTITILEAPGRVLYMSRASSFSQLLLYQNKLVTELRKVPKIKKLESDSLCGFYELDILINDDYVLEVDSQLHYVWCKSELPVVSSFIKTYHLMLMGFKNVMSVGFNDKELQDRVYSVHKDYFPKLVDKLLLNPAPSLKQITNKFAK